MGNLKAALKTLSRHIPGAAADVPASTLAAVLCAYHGGNGDACRICNCSSMCSNPSEPTPAYKLEAGCVVKTPRDGTGTVVAVRHGFVLHMRLAWVIPKYVAGKEWLNDDDNTCFNGKIYRAKDLTVTEPAPLGIGKFVQSKWGACGIVVAVGKHYDAKVAWQDGSVSYIPRNEYTVMCEKGNANAPI